MAAAQKHIIERQELHVQMENVEDAFGFRNKLAELYHDVLAPRIENVLDEVSLKQTIRIDRLQIAVGNLSPAGWEDELVTRVISGLKDELELAKLSAKRQINLAVEEPDSERTTGKYNVNDWLFYYLDNGRLPWYISSQFSTTEIKSGLVNVDGDFLCNYLQQAGKYQLERVIYLLNEEELEQLLARIIPGVSQPDFHFILVYKRLFYSLLNLITQSKHAATKYFYLPLLMSLKEEHRSFLQSFLHYFTNYTTTDFDVEQKALKHQLIEMLQSIPPVDGIRLKDAVEEVMDMKSLEPDEDVQSKKAPAGTIYIHNAGLVLLHPFLLHFFRKLNLLMEEKFTNIDCRQRAVLLTQHLATGELEFAEHDLVLSKILCAVSIDMPVPLRLQLTEQEAIEAGELLQSVISQWTMNGVKVNNSLEGLRSSFISRNGKLTCNGSDWKLLVEQQPYDMVLSSFPWGIAIIRHSWMNGMLWVDWA